MTFSLEPIGDYVDPVSKWNPKAENACETFRYIDLGSVDQETKSIALNGEILVKDAPSRAKQILKHGDILVSTVRPNLNGVAFVPEELEGAIGSTGFCVLRPKPKKMCGRYLFHWVKNAQFVADITKKATGQSYPAVSDRIVKDSLIPLPKDIDEQTRIATILDRADELRFARCRSLDQIENLKYSIFFQMFGNPLTDSQTPKKPLGKCVRLINGRAYKKNEEREEGTPVLRIQNLNGGDRWFYSDLKLPEDKYCVAGDLLFAWSATFGPYIWGGEKVIYHYHIWKIECGEEVEKIYMYWLLKVLSSDVKRGGRGISMTHATKGGMEERLIPVPDKKIQRKFVERIKKIDALNEIMQSDLKCSENLFLSLQRRAFRGEL
jgi:type I restriction enzyme S subunit